MTDSMPFNYTELNRVIDFLSDELERGQGDVYCIEDPDRVREFLGFYRVTDEQAALQAAIAATGEGA